MYLLSQISGSKFVRLNVAKNYHPIQWGGGFKEKKKKNSFSFHATETE